MNFCYVISYICMFEMVMSEIKCDKVEDKRDEECSEGERMNLTQRMIQ